MKYPLTVLFIISLFVAHPAMAEEGMAMTDSWLPSLITATPEAGFALAITLSRKSVTSTQTDIDKLKVMRQKYSHDPDSLIASSHVIAVHFQTIAAANNYWRGTD